MVYCGHDNSFWCSDQAGVLNSSVLSQIVVLRVERGQLEN